jgi:hypothetical protein
VALFTSRPELEVSNDGEQDARFAAPAPPKNVRVRVLPNNNLKVTISPVADPARHHDVIKVSKRNDEKMRKRIWERRTIYKSKFF